MNQRDRRHLMIVRILCASMLLVVACRDQAADDQATVVPPDSLPTLREARASLAGALPPDAQVYTYRQLSAGMTRTALESHLMSVAGSGVLRCEPVPGQPQEELCSADVMLRPDSAAAHLDVTFLRAGTATGNSGEVAHEIIVTRPLPLDVDGVELARTLADAFERQTSLLDKRDATYGHHAALLRMGTVNAGARQNFVEVEVKLVEGREQMRVRLSRGAEPPKVVPPKVAPPTHSD